MNTANRSTILLKAAFEILLHQKRLWVFPSISLFAIIALAAIQLAPIIFYPTGHVYYSVEHLNALGERAARIHAFHSTAISGIAFYLVTMLIATFFNVAFYHEIMQALNGNSVSIQRGIRFAAKRWRVVLLWSLFAGLIGYLIGSIEEKVGVVGKLVVGIIGTGWNIACIFVIPSIVNNPESYDPIKMLQQSAFTIKRTWGELIAGFFSLELPYSNLTMLAIVSAGCGGFYLGFHFQFHYMLILALGLAAMGIIALPLLWIGKIVNDVFRCALYIYATEGVIPGSFGEEMMNAPWVVK